MWLTVAGAGIGAVDLGKKRMDIARGNRARSSQKAYEARNRELAREATSRGLQLP